MAFVGGAYAADKGGEVNRTEPKTDEAKQLDELVWGDCSMTFTLYDDNWEPVGEPIRKTITADSEEDCHSATDREYWVIVALYPHNNVVGAGAYY